MARSVGQVAAGPGEGVVVPIAERVFGHRDNETVPREMRCESAVEQTRAAGAVGDDDQRICSGRDGPSAAEIHGGIDTGLLKGAGEDRQVAARSHSSETRTSMSSWLSVDTALALRARLALWWDGAIRRFRSPTGLE